MGEGHIRPIVIDSQGEPVEKVASGEVKFGDVVELGDYYGAISNSHGMLDHQFGVNAENCKQVKGIVGHLKTLTIEASDGTQKTFQIPQADDFDMTKLEAMQPLKILDQKDQFGPAPNQEGLNGAVRLQTFGYWQDSYERLAAAERLFKYLHDQQKDEKTKVDGYILSWERNLLEDQAAGSAPPTDLSSSDKSYLDQMMQMERDRVKWEPFKVVSATISPSISLRFFKAKTEHGFVAVSPVLMVDRPVEPPKKHIKPLWNSTTVGQFR